MIARRCAMAGALALGGLAAGLPAGLPAQAAPTQVTMALFWGGNQLTLLKQDIAEYEQLHPDIQIQLQLTDWGDYLQKLETLHAAGSSPDIVDIYTLWADELTGAGLLDRPPTEVANVIDRDFIPVAKAGATDDGQIWGFPNEIEDYQLIYYKSKFENSGLTPPATWDAFVDDAKRLTVTSAAGQTTAYGFAMELDELPHPYLSVLFGEGGTLFTDDHKRAALDSPQALAALQKLVRLFSEGGSSAKTDVYGFTKGNPAMAIMAPWYIGALKGVWGDQLDQRVGAAAIPPGPAGKATLAYTFFWGVDSNAPHKQAAWAFLEWLNSKRSATGTSRAGDILVDQGIMPATTFDLENHPSLHGTALQPFVDAMNYAHIEGSSYKGNEIKQLISAALLKAYSLASPPKTVLTQLNTQINALLAGHY